MIAELGHLSLICALVVALLLGVLPLVGRRTNNQALLGFAPSAALLLGALVALAYATLTLAFVRLDFSLQYVADNANSQLPLLYRISGVWGAHEGSFLLWILCLCGWSAMFAWRSQVMPLRLRATILAVLGLVSSGFLLFILFTSNPFTRLLPAASDGRDLNPLLQDVGLAIHPPTLYLGYVGFAIAFAFAMAAMLEGRLDKQWARWLKPWVNTAWAMLSLGIVLGSWWAYNELGWGGWWFWDPVENASFMPWLVGAALLHSLTATEQRGLARAWTLLLAILTFALSLLGTFLVRSGVITSVHAFANDPARGLFILLLLGLVIGSSLVLYSLRAHLFVAKPGMALVSRETALLFNNMFLLVITATVLLGTLYPLVFDALGLGKLSVGPPYFTSVIVPLATPLFIAVGIGGLLRWGKDSLSRNRRLWLGAAALALLAGLLVPLLGSSGYDWRIGLGSALAMWITATMLAGLVGQLRRANWRWRALPMPGYAMLLGHLGLAVFCIGVAFSSANSVELVRALAPGETTNIQGYAIRYLGTEQRRRANYVSTVASFDVSRHNRAFRMEAEKRFYPVQNNTMTEAAIRPRLSHDLFIALGEPLPGDDAWSVRIQYKSFIRFIWLGGLMLAAAALLENFSGRYRRKPISQPHSVHSKGAQQPDTPTLPNLIAQPDIRPPTLPAGG